MYAAMRIPFRIISPGKIDFLDKMFFLFFLRKAAPGEKKGNEYNKDQAVAKSDF
jgi:hypothetical protein